VVEMPEERSLDVDTAEDLAAARAVLEAGPGQSTADRAGDSSSSLR
jgi:hypothetical protein